VSEFQFIASVAAIRKAYDEGGALSAAVEPRRRAAGVAEVQTAGLCGRARAR